MMSASSLDGLHLLCLNLGLTRDLDQVPARDRAWTRKDLQGRDWRPSLLDPPAPRYLAPLCAMFRHRKDAYMCYDKAHLHKLSDKLLPLHDRPSRAQHHATAVFTREAERSGRTERKAGRSKMSRTRKLAEARCVQL